MTSKSSSSNKPAVAANRQITIWQLTCKVIKRTHLAAGVGDVRLCAGLSGVHSVVY